MQSLVHSMLAEQLNCSGWQERLAACQMLPRLHGGINKVSKTKAGQTHMLNGALSFFLGFAS